MVVVAVGGILGVLVEVRLIAVLSVSLLAVVVVVFFGMTGVLPRSK